ncbi:hypothetical protein C9374_003202 [Naegleria lovaniensis]|uniref:Postreplication repair E3 ubiquitin-protein ligase RAD18 n=1 Tax=Naegleria lovaniensis TaxID=51637 RepID=A0AA88GU47_NAELO|nr:uncharacterized protein C9374_003202 [Naegleria lovaniensis]KAG2386053.1 hypothetical protein C9374_003202 [Naegleria lovaniensis]
MVKKEETTSTTTSSSANNDPNTLFNCDEETLRDKLHQYKVVDLKEQLKKMGLGKGISGLRKEELIGKIVNNRFLLPSLPPNHDTTTSTTPSQLVKRKHEQDEEDVKTPIKASSSQAGTLFASPSSLINSPFASLNVSTPSSSTGMVSSSTSATQESVTSPKKKVKLTEEKRKARFVSKPSIATKERIARALTQRLYLIERKNRVDNLEEEFVVLGSTGNVYNVNICEVPSCSCPDFEKGNLCKHILFVFLRVLRVNQNSHCVYQKALLHSELESIFKDAPPIPTSVQASERVVKEYKHLTGEAEGESVQESTTTKQKPLHDAHCPICYEAFSGSEKTDFCKVCGNNIHEDCIKMWKGFNPSFPCPVCRAPQLGKASANKKVVENEGYANLADFQSGMTREREYYHSSRWYSRRRYYDDDDDDYDEDDDYYGSTFE